MISASVLPENVRKMFYAIRSQNLELNQSTCVQHPDRHAKKIVLIIFHSLLSGFDVSVNTIPTKALRNTDQMKT